MVVVAERSVVEIKVVILPWGGLFKQIRALKVRRPFVGLTVSQALLALHEDTALPGIMSPFYVNNEEVRRTSDRVLQEGDILTVNDP